MSRIFGFLRDVAMAQTLGASLYTDVFAVAFKLPNLFRRIFAEGAFMQSFLPSYAKARYKSIFSVKIAVSLFGTIFILSCLVTIFPEFFTKMIASGFSDEKIALASPLTAINFWYLDFIFLVTFIASLLQYKKHFATTAFATTLLNISMIISLVFFTGESKEDTIYNLSWAVLVGGVLQLLAHLVVAKFFGINRMLLTGIKNFKRKNMTKEKKKFFSEFFHSIWGNSTAQVNAFLDTILASFLVTGSLSYLYYANRVFQLPLALFAIASSIVLFPRVVRALKKDDETEALKQLKKIFWIVFPLLTIATIIAITFAKEIVWFLFERGEFSKADTINSAFILQMYMLSLIPFGLAKLFSLFLYASSKQKQAAKIATISLIANICFSVVLMNVMGAAGLALAGSIGGFILFGLTLREFGLTKFKALF